MHNFWHYRIVCFIMLCCGFRSLFYWIWQAEKLHTKTLPYPFTSKEVFEQSIRVPVGPEFNPATAVRALTRPDVSSLSQSSTHWLLLEKFGLSLHTPCLLHRLVFPFSVTSLWIRGKIVIWTVNVLTLGIHSSFSISHHWYDYAGEEEIWYHH